MSNEPLALVVGQVGIELLCRVPRLASEAPLEMDEVSIQVAGRGAIASAAALALGCRVRLGCKLDDGFIGRHIRSALEGTGIETHAVTAAGSELSPLWITALDPHLDKASYYTRGDVEALDAGELDPVALLDGAGALLIDGTSPATQIDIAHHARRARVPVVLDGDKIRDGLGTLVGLADVLIASERLAAELAPRDDLEACLREIRLLGPKAVVITLGDAGAIGIHGDTVHRQDAYPVDVVDTRGAGSVFHGAFAAAILGGLPFRSCMSLAAAAAALSCKHLGGFAGIPRRDDVVALVRDSTARANVDADAIENSGGDAS